MKYNRSLDLLCAAVVYAKKGRVNAAAKCFEAAVRCPSSTTALRVVQANNSEAYSKLVASTRRRIQADIDKTMGISDKGPGAELKVEPEEHEDRVVQEAEFDDLDELDEDESDVKSAADEEVIKDEEEEEEEEEQPAMAALARSRKVRTTANSDFARALRNIHALATTPTRSRR